MNFILNVFQFPSLTPSLQHSTSYSVPNTFKSNKAFSAEIHHPYFFSHFGLFSPLLKM